MIDFIACAEEIKDYELYAKSAVLLDGETGRILFIKNGEEHLANASTTKILTCILVLESGKMEEYAYVSKLAASQPDVQANLCTGEYYKVKDLLYSIMLESHNDSAYVLAEHVAGSVEGFAEQMNELSKKIGCTNSWFVTPNGLDMVDAKTGVSHGTSALDLAKIMKYCIEDSFCKEEFLEITGTMSYQFCNYCKEQTGDGFYEGNHRIFCTNHNSLLGSFDGMISGKTGYTSQAGYCYVGAVKTDGRIYIVSLLGSGWPPNKIYKWVDAKKLFYYGMNEYRNIEYEFGEEELPFISVKNGVPESLSYEEKTICGMNCHNKKKMILLNGEERIEKRYDFPKELDRELTEGELIGFVSYFVSGYEIEKIPVYADSDISIKNKKWAVITLWKMFLERFGILSDN